MDTIRFPRSAIFVLLFLSFLGLPNAKAQITTTSNAFIAADVEDASGIILIYLAGTSPKEYLTYPGFSYITVRVGGDFFTNNPNGATLVEPSDTQVTPIFLGADGKTTLLIAASHGTDTIRTTWQPKGPNTFDIVQDVYPVAGMSSGQIVYKWSIVNHNATGLTAQAQFLLDLFTSSNSPDTANDNPAVTTRDGYNFEHWQDISNVPYFITSERGVCAAGFLGILGAGFTSDEFAPVPMNLMQPSEVEIVGWEDIATQFLFGFPTSLVGTPTNDNAMLFQWPATGVFGAKLGNPTVQEIGRGCYGTPSCTPITYGSLDALLLHPDHIKWNGSAYVPNHFPVEAIVWNSNNNANATGAVATQTISSITGQYSGPVQVLPTRIASGGYVQAQLLQSGGSSRPDSLVPECGMGFVTWEDTVLQSVLTNCATDSSYDISLSISAANIPEPIFPFGLPVCPVIVDCQEKDFTPPRHSQHIFSDTNHCGNPMTFRDSVFDNLAIDHGIQSITYTVTPTPNAVAVTGGSISFPGCPAVVGPITATQLDTLQGACVFFTYTDCAGNVSYDSVCFAACAPVISGLDTIPPKFWLLRKYNFNNNPDSICNFEASNWSVTDSQKNASGLQSVSVLDSFNMSAIIPNVAAGQSLVNFGVFVQDPGKSGMMTMKAVDEAGNISFDSLNYCPAVEDVAISLAPSISLSISPNPASGVAMISLTGAPSANVEIFDVLGRQMASFRIAGSYEWHMSALSPGTYIVRVNASGAVISGRVVKE